MRLSFFNKHTKVFGFTLAELLVVLAVLSVVAAILLPTVFSSMPDENRLKFKKGYYTLKRTIDAMVNSEAYTTTEGNFGVILNDNEDAPGFAAELSDGQNGSRYFCIQFSEMLNSTQTQCSEGQGDYLNTTGVISDDFAATNLTTTSDSNSLDGKCDAFMATEDSKKYINVATQDGIYWSLPYDNFSGKAGSNQVKTISGYGKVPAYYAVVCMDVDGVGGQPAFGFGIRRDGKVIAGKRAKDWLQEGTTTVVTNED